MPNISNYFHPTLFADDTTITVRDSSRTNLTTKCDEVLDKLFDWTTSNRLTINYDKTFYLIITNQFNTEHSDYSFSLNGHILDMKRQGKFLGIILDDKLKFNHHIDYICNKISKSIGIIYRLKDVLPRHCLFSLYYSFIYPYLTYCNLIWGGTYDTHLNPLNILQKKAIRIINNQPYLAHTEPLFNSSNLLTLHDIHKYFLAIYMYKHRNSQLYLRSHHHNTRQRTDLLPSYRRLTSTQHSLSYAGPLIWNSLTDDLRNSVTLPIFKNRLKSYFISQYQNRQT